MINSRQGKHAMEEKPVNFYKLLQQRIAEHAEKDLARYGINLNQPAPKPITSQRKWLDKFKRIHGMSYSTWLYKKKHSRGTTEETTQPVEAPSLPQDEPTPALA